MKYLSVLILLILSLEVYCCDCKTYYRDSTSVMTALNNSSVVGVIEVVDIIQTANSNNDDHRIVKVKIITPYKGVRIGEIIEVSSFTDVSGCGISLETGIRYLLYAYPDEKRGLSTNICTRTRIFTSSIYDPIIL